PHDVRQHSLLFAEARCTSAFVLIFFLQRPVDHRHLHSFPTRRSSDLEKLACASTGNLANSVSAHAAAGGMEAVVCVGAHAVREVDRKEHTSELQSRENLVCRLLLEKKKKMKEKKRR